MNDISRPRNFDGNLQFANSSNLQQPEGGRAMNGVNSDQARGRKIVLIVDDDYGFCQAVADSFDHAEFEVLTAYDGNAGLALALVKQPDLILLDTRMPRRSGYLVVEHLRYASDLQCPIIMMSEHEGGRHREYAKMLGVKEFLEKPIQPEKLVSLALTVLHQHESA